MEYVYGLNKSGISIIKFFNKNKIKYHCWDDNEYIRKKVSKIILNNKLINPDLTNLNEYTHIYVSPGITVRQKKFKKINKNKLVRDLNLYWSHISNEKIVAISGTNGKSTTTKLIGDMIKKHNISAFVGGNLGKPLLDSLLVKKKFTHHVIELSSFQLELISSFNPKISVLLNISQDHLDRYIDFKDYINQKKKVFTNNKTGYNLISLDDTYCKNFYKNRKIINKISFSTKNKNADIYYNNFTIYDNFFNLNKKIKINKISRDLNGDFNYQNILVAYIVSKILKISKNIFLNNLSNFKGLPYRNKILVNNKNLIIINNSKATNVEAAYKSLQNYNNVILILGGTAKEKNFKKIKKLSDKIEIVYAFGHSSEFIKNQLHHNIKVKKYKDLELVIKNIYKSFKENLIKKTLLFAPACTSYDQYKNFEERGKHFDLLIKKYNRRFINAQN